MLHHIEHTIHNSPLKHKYEIISYDFVYVNLVVTKAGIKSFSRLLPFSANYNGRYDCNNT